jgi:hypothetical protein
VFRVEIMSTHYIIRLVDAQGGLVAEMQDSAGLIDESLVAHAETCNGLARYIDPYGKTSFNGIQCEALFAEIEGIEPTTLSDAQRASLRQLNDLLQRAATEVHLHLVLLGD